MRGWDRSSPSCETARPSASVAVRPTAGAEWLVAAEAGDGVQMLPAEERHCAEAIVAFCG